MVLVVENVTPGLLPNCSNCTRTAAQGVDITKAVVVGLILGIVIVFGILGNILVIVSVASHRHLQTVTHYFIVNLAVADLLLTTTVLPFSATFEILGYWVFGRIFCNIWAAVDVLCCTASIMSLCMISVDRYVGVSYPLRYPSIMTEKRGLLMLVGLWALSITISIGPLFGWKEPAPDDETICKITEEPGYAIFSAFGSFYVPMTIILIMYCRVYVVAKRATRDLKLGMKIEKSNSEAVTLRIHRKNVVPSDETLRSRTPFSIQLHKFSREKKAAKTLGIVVGCFILCWLPFFLVLPIGSIFPAYKPSETVFKITFWLGYFNSCINPIIYRYSSQEFKKAFQNVLHARCSQSRAGSMPKSSSLGWGHGRLGVSGSDAHSPMTPVYCQVERDRSGCEWKVVHGVLTSSGEHPTNRATASAHTRSKTLLRECCCVVTENTHPPQVPVIKVHTMSLCENGEAV
ncbi:alpha-1A adrenergic receptor-like [Erpetoichthys calabaricus]|uniref:Alpha-1A adrenergic receptor n=1 Tax=Erpetoichthys calabaricus TaxID=27687 RepID=A0A8C4S5C7_ERPCA|nr:alpha-1A adrenergic receptor-like [Erpetoichthys calabaricus]